MGISALTPPTKPEDMVETLLEFPDNRLLIELCGEYDRNLAQIEHQLGIHVLRRGNRLTVVGEKGAREQAAAVLRSLYARLEAGRGVVAAGNFSITATLLERANPGAIEERRESAGKLYNVSEFAAEVALAAVDPVPADNTRLVGDTSSFAGE